jgi:hypothetical protein
VYKDALKIYGDIREGLSRERRTMCALKAKPGYDSDGSESMSTKQVIEQYKSAAEHVVLGLNNTREGNATILSTVNNATIPSTVQPTATNNEGVNDDSIDSKSI